MRLVLFEGPGAGRGIRPGVLTATGVVDVSSATAALVAHSPQHLMEQIIDSFEALRPASLLDLGANTGEMSRIASARGVRTTALDADPACVEAAFRSAREADDACLLPLVADLTNPSPAQGFAHRERASLAGRD